jgi:hypothetical protein
MALKPGDKVRLKNTDTRDQHRVKEDAVYRQWELREKMDGNYDGVEGVVLKGPYNKKEYGDIPIYTVRLDIGQTAECTWSALEKIGEENAEYFAAVNKWEEALNE